jgi:hypothetical protein
MLDDHRRPGQRLERNPMQTDRETKREDRHDSPEASKHAGEGSECAPACQSTTVNYSLSIS